MSDREKELEQGLMNAIDALIVNADRCPVDGGYDYTACTWDEDKEACVGDNIECWKNFLLKEYGKI